MRRIEAVANLLIILVCVLLITVLVRNRGFHPKGTPPLQNSIVGTRVTLDRVDWKLNGKTLLLAIKTDCHFCSESAPFYRRLLQTASSANVSIVAVALQPAAQIEAYLASLSVAVHNVRQIKYETLSVRATPTILLVDDGGRVTRAWIGKLRPNEEEEVVATISK